MALEAFRQLQELYAEEVLWRAEILDEERATFVRFRQHALPLFNLPHESLLPPEARSRLVDGELILYGGADRPSPMVHEALDTRLDRVLPTPLVVARFYAREARSRARLYNAQALAWPEEVERQAARLLSNYRRKRWVRALADVHRSGGLCGCGHHSCELCNPSNE